jgi:hypothetical protein
MASLDGSATGVWSSGTTMTTGTLTCTNAGNVIVVKCFMLAGGGDISGVTATGGGITFTQRVDAGLPDLQEWVGYYAGTFNDTIVVSHSGTPVGGSVHAFAINGPPSSAYFDTDAGLPVSFASFTLGDGDPISLDTDGNDTFIIAAFRTEAATNTAGSGWTGIASSDNITSMYRIASAPQTGLSATLGTPGDAYSSIADAFVFTPASSGGLVVPVPAAQRNRRSSGWFR